MPFSNERRKPLMSEPMAITVPTPITIPRSASSDRIRFALSAWRAMRNVSRKRNPSVIPRAWTTASALSSRPYAAGRVSLVAERLHGVEPRGTRGGGEPKKHAKERRAREPDDPRPGGDEGGQRRGRGQEPRH